MEDESGRVSKDLHPGGPDRSNGETMIRRLLRSARTHLNVEVAFVGELHDGVRTFRYVDQASGVGLLAPGDSDAAETSYCQHIIDGRLPLLLVDARRDPVASSLPATEQVPVGSHVSVPIRFADGRLYGTFCCFSRAVHEHLDERHVAAVRALAELAGEYLEAIEKEQTSARARRQRIVDVLESPIGMEMVFQPLFDLRSGDVVSVEALARFPGHDQGPEWFFTEAAHHGLGVELETHAVELALRRLPDLPEPVRLNVNVSGDTLVDRRFLDQVAGVPPDRLVVEVTELSVIEDYTAVDASRRQLEGLGIRLSIDDVGMGWSGLNRILECAPHQLKLDASVIRGVHRHPVRQALIEAFCSFASRADVEVVAEGIEQAEELATLRAFGVAVGQGYHLGRPGSLDALFRDGQAIIDLVQPLTTEPPE